MPHRIQVRAAEVDDVSAIAELLAPFAEKEIILPRSRDDIFQHLQEFVVAFFDEDLAGVAALHIYGSNLAEVRSLVVRDDMQGRDIGRLLLEACEKWGAGLGVACIFALTYVPEFFLSHGYEQVLKESLPHKIWTVCVHCSKFADCDEVAVQKRLSDAPIQPMRVVPILEVDQP
ncbi:MAG: N-acetyltransferase [Mariprofundaceae bacterium]|nr:N-acetyltransferase [Mariprofundaceae bacterium]